MQSQIKHIYRISQRILLPTVFLLALILRLSPTLYLMGGQDQGTYVSMAQQYAKNRKQYVIDEYRQTLTPKQQELYDRDGNYIMPSFENWNREGSEYSMVFYPMHPALLSIFGTIFGMDNSVYLLTIFSVLTVILVYFLIYEITKNKKTAVIGMLLFALNPVHIFMSKYPVGETTALFFIIGGYYFLIKFLKSTKKLAQKIPFLVFSLIAFFAFSLTRMTFFIHIPVIFFITIYNKKELEEKLVLTLYALLNLGSLVLSYKIYQTYFYPLFKRLYPKTIEKLLTIYFPVDISNNYKIAIIFGLIILLLGLSLWKKLEKPAEKIIPFLCSLGTLGLAIKIGQFAKQNYLYLTGPRASYFARFNIIPERGLDIIKHLPLFSVANYVSHIGLILFAGLIIYNLIKLGKTKYWMLTGIAVYFAYVYLSRTRIMRYDYYNSRYYLTEVIPSILLPIGILLGNLIQGKKWQKGLGYGSLSLIILYFSFFSFFQLGKYEGNDRQFYKDIENQVTQKDLIVFINKRIYKDKHSRNFNSYVAGPLKYYFNYNVLMLRSAKETKEPVAKSIIDKHENVYYISNVPQKENENFENEKKLTLKYNYFNNPTGCNYHNYEFLETVNVREWPLPSFLECKLLPNAYFENERVFYFGNLTPNLENIN